MMDEREQILKQLALLKSELSETYHIASLMLFGSLARGEQTRSSDIDLLVDFSVTPDLLTFIELEERIKKRVGRDVDLVLRRKLRSELTEQIEREAIAV